MNDWARALTTLAFSFVTLVLVTLGLANAIVSVTGHGGGNGEAPTRSDLGGSLLLTGDREAAVSIRPSDPGTIVARAFAEDERFSLTGDGLRMSFEADPIEVAHIAYDGLEFFPRNSDCIVTPLESGGEPGVRTVTLECRQLRDIRGNGMLSLNGEIALPATLVVDRTLPYSGGSVRVGDEIWDFDKVTVVLTGMRDGQTSEYELHSFSGFQVRSLGLIYDSDTGDITVVTVERNGEVGNVAAGDCETSRMELGEYAQILVAEIQIRCASVEVPGEGAVQIEGSVIVDEVEFRDVRGR